MSAPVGVVGGGGFGRGLAIAAARNEHEVVHWSRKEREPVHEGVRATTSLADMADCGLIFVAVPSMFVPDVAPKLGEHLDGRHYLVHVSRGLIGDDLQTVSRHLAKVTPARRVGVLAGPLNPTTLEQGLPGGGIVGTRFSEVAEAVKAALGSPRLRLYTTKDIVGVEVASAMVGLLALQAGFCLERDISPSAMAVMMTRGLAEAARVGERLGGSTETFHGLAGAGDLYAAIGGDERAEVQLGRALDETLDLAGASKTAGAYVEGLAIARRVARYAERHGVDAPIATVTAAVFEGEMKVDIALRALMER